MSFQDEILVIGGGVIGVSAAYYLARQGRQVTLLEADEICAGASYGNAGFILPSHIIPLAAPGTLGQGLKWLLDPESPFYIKPRLSLELISWLWRFRAACQQQRMRRSMRLLRELSHRSIELHQELAGLQGLDFGFQKKGYLKLFKTSQGYQKANAEAGLMREFGIEARMMNQAEIREVEPNILPGVSGGLYFPHDAHLIPADFVLQLGRVIEDLGVKIRTSTEVLGFETAPAKILTVKTTRGNFKPDQVILAGGAWSPSLADDLGIRLPIQPAKGYSLTFKRSANSPSIPVMLSEAAVAVSPLAETVRFAGTLELAGWDQSINQRRVNAIVKKAGEYLPGVEGLELAEIWRGFRPCLPDGLPVIGRSSRYKNLILATGHATIGMALGPVTGELVSQLAAHETTQINLTGLRLERFS
ncbi:MAG: FAD-dependent oxidoreductase [Deltaproteobacteria bacterium]|nr:FAD-dependent oxidoreductase [Deltaproteobacteria bacterium]MBW2051924.1 FAD-dependent oxidoreductase [Deltaproteobacteria bacterium]